MNAEHMGQNTTIKGNGAGPARVVFRDKSVVVMSLGKSLVMDRDASSGSTHLDGANETLT